jgi:tRNA(Ile)-lysidine synthase
MQLNQETLLQSIRQNKLFPPETRLIVAVSGGADSLALLHALAHLRPIYPLVLTAATLNHGLRPEAAEEVAFVQQMASGWNVPCVVGHVELPVVGIEAAARKARYNFLAEVAETTNSPYIVTAHQADDQTETILMHLIRGSGIQGLIGMSMSAPLPCHPEYILCRPLLPFSRASIESYCAEYGLEPRKDSSNFDMKYRRNAIRHEIVPRLRQLNPQIDTALARLGQIVAAEEEYMQQEYNLHILPQIEFVDYVSIPRAAFSSWHLAMQRRVLLAALAHLKVNPDFERIEAALQIIKRSELGAIAEFNAYTYLRLSYNHIQILNRQSIISDSNYLQINEDISLTLPSITQIGDFQLIVTEAPTADFIAHLAIPADAQARLRRRRDGDRFRPLGMGGSSRKLKKWLIDRKIPQYLRDNLPLLEINGEIAAILLPASWGISEVFAVQADSLKVLYFSVKKL